MSIVEFMLEKIPSTYVNAHDNDDAAWEVTYTILILLVIKTQTKDVQIIQQKLKFKVRKSFSTFIRSTVVTAVKASEKIQTKPNVDLCWICTSECTCHDDTHSQCSSI